MKSIPFLQRNAVRQLFETRPSLRQAFRQLQRSQTAFRTRPLQTASLTRSIRTRQPTTNSLTQAFRRRAPNGRRYNSSAPAAAPEEKLSVSQRLKRLSKEYGWTAVGVYFALSALDFPFCFLAVKLLGTDRIGHWEHVILSHIKELLKWPLPKEAKEQVDGASGQLKDGPEIEEGATKRVLEEPNETYAVQDHGYKEAEAANRGDNASIWTQLALAYAVHKSFIFLRVPLTAAVLPKVVKTLRSWGWNIGRTSSKKAVTAGQSSATGINSKGSRVKPDD
ncbi:uncharacterized protein Z518_05572 [Rhinocladiella mackenziei CBS 650.93]|uniref:DUF1279 domain-containing protein n=1 Tax=Rhinocladiella mackenziei CBS 650.93 TaxID=1442369 RepID=A0A0D2FR71_9EURO|nr:uncharacterized protein Z518_05572 [Rhinocladiella mackenziei CBS 650.93]KIX04702.1 hypothetical protein Z518_05572 [Rhinocladiella mackenziei CBS 650.93]